MRAVCRPVARRVAENVRRRRHRRPRRTCRQRHTGGTVIAVKTACRIVIVRCWPFDDARVQSGRAGLGRRGQERADRAIRVRPVHGEVRPDHRGLLPEGNRGGQLAVRARDTGHGRYRAVRQHARLVHKKRTGFRRSVQPDQSPDVPGHKAHEGAHHQGEGVRACTHTAGSQ